MSTSIRPSIRSFVRLAAAALALLVAAPIADPAGAVVAHPLAPAEGAAGFHRHACSDCRWQHPITPRRILRCEHFPRRHRDDACRNTLGVERFRCGDRHGDFRTGGNHDGARRSRRFARCRAVNETTSTSRSC